MTPEQARFAARLFNTKGVPQDRLAKMFGVDRTIITQSIRRAKGGRMDDVVDLTGLTDSQKKLVKVLQAHAQKLVAAELARLELPIRTAMAAINTRVETQLQAQIARLDEALAKADAEPKHEGMMI